MHRAEQIDPRHLRNAPRIVAIGLVYLLSGRLSYGEFTMQIAGNPASAKPLNRSCPEAWCNWRVLASMLGWAGTHQFAMAGRLMMGSSLMGAMVSSVM